jgi:hypothetical protein
MAMILLLNSDIGNSVAFWGNHKKTSMSTVKYQSGQNPKQTPMPVNLPMKLNVKN